MAECFCGCGRQVSRFPLGIRTINKRGELVAQRLAWANAFENEDGKHVGDFELPGEEGEGTWLDHGTALVAMLATIVHGKPVEEIKDHPHAQGLAARLKPDLDVTQAASDDWLKNGWIVEHFAVEIGVMPIKQWLKS